MEGTSARFATLRTLRYRDFRLFWFAMLAAVYGHTTEFLAIGWLVYQLTESPLNLGTAGLTQAIPNIVLTFVGGALADRVDRRRVMQASQAVSAALFLGLGALVTTGAIQVWHVYVFAFIYGCVRAFDSSSRQAIIPLLLPPEDIGRGVAMINVVWQLPRLVGPAIAGVVIAGWGVGVTFHMAGAGMVAALLLVAAMRTEWSAPEPTGRSFFRQILDGLDYIRRDQVALALIGMTFFNSVFGMSYVFLLPVFARDVWQVGSEGYGFLQSAAAVGAVLGAIVAAQLSASSRRGFRSILSAGLYGGLLAVFAVSAWFPLALAIIFLIGIAHQIYMTIINTVLLLNTADEYRGRVLGVYGLAWAIVPLGAGFAGLTAELTSAPTAVVLGGALVGGMAVLIGLALPRVRDLE